MQTLVSQFMLLKDATGTIQANDYQQERLDELTDRVASGEFHVATDGKVPCKCKDGRSSPRPVEGANAAGGTESIFVADDLTTKHLAAADGSVCGGMQNIIQTLQGLGYSVGGHTDNRHTDPQQSGCGANDRLSEIYEMMTAKPAAVKALTEVILGAGSVDAATEQLILKNAAQRGDFAFGYDVVSLLRDIDDAKIEELQGSHNEVVAAINLRPGTTLDRRAIVEEFGVDYQAFNVDAWSFHAAAKATSLSVEEIQQKVIAMTYYNIATALVLCGPNMRVILVK